MKLLIINNIPLPLPPVKGGAVEYLVDEFIKNNEKTKNYDITVYSIFNASAKEKSKNYKKTQFKYIEIKTIFDKIDRVFRHIINKHFCVYIGNTYISKVVKSIIDFNEYDAIIVENVPEFALKIPKTYKNRLILHLHNDRLNYNTKNHKKIFDLYDEIYTISNTLGQYVQTIEKSKKVKTLYNGIEVEKFVINDGTKVEIRDKYGIKPNDFVFMYAGRIVPEKGVYELATAFSRLKGNDYKLLIVGGTGYDVNTENEYVKKIKSINDNRIVFTGFIPYEDMPGIYSVANVGVAPSICRDAFNLTVVEFLASCVPVIISDRGAMKELVDDHCAVIVKCDDDFENNIYVALATAKSSFSDIKIVSDKCLSISKKFSIEKYCENFGRLLDNDGDTKEYRF